MPHNFQITYHYLIAAFIAGVLLGYGISYILPINTLLDIQVKGRNVKIADIKGTNNPVNTTTIDMCDIQVEVAGAVNRPGVFCFTEGDIVNKALIASGGLNRLAANRYVSQRVNLAERLTGNQKIYIPYEDDLKCDLIKFLPDTNLGNYIDGEGSACISINSATQKELETLKGVGEVTAGKIISGRAYSKVEEIKEKGGVSEKLFESIKADICL